MSRLVLRVLMFSAVLIATDTAASDAEFEAVKERFFSIGREMCLEKMTKFHRPDRLIFCDCTDELHRSLLTDEQLVGYFSGAIELVELLAPARKRYDACNERIEEQRTEIPL